MALVPVGLLAVSVFPPYIRARTFNAISVIFLEEDADEINSITTPRPRKNRNPFSKLKQLFSPKPFKHKKKRRPTKPPIRRPRKRPVRRPRKPPARLRPPTPPRKRPLRRPKRSTRRFFFSSYLDGARNMFYRFQARCRRLRRQIAWHAGLKVRTSNSRFQLKLKLIIKCNFNHPCQDNRDEEGNYLARSSWRTSLSRSLNLEGLTEKARSGAARMFGGGEGEALRRQDLNDTQSRLQFARIPRDQERESGLHRRVLLNKNLNQLLTWLVTK